MQFLANENFPLDAVEAVRKIGHDSCLLIGTLRPQVPSYPTLT
jgi:hypothetical protein